MDDIEIPAGALGGALLNTGVVNGPVGGDQLVDDAKARRRKGQSVPSFTLPAKVPNSLSAAGATALARRIERFWAAEGYSVRTWTIPVVSSEHGSTMGVRSNLINGFPRARLL
jgi:hypothetical protein